MLRAREGLGNVYCSPSSDQKVKGQHQMEEGLCIYSPYTPDTVGAIGRPGPGLLGGHGLKLDLQNPMDSGLVQG